MGKIFYQLLLLVLLNQMLLGQSPTISPQILNSGGDHRQIGSSGIWITDNVGEPFTTTLDNIGSMMITQGFIQPERISKGGFTLTTQIQHHQCLDKEDDAFIKLNLASTIPAGKYRAEYIWSPPEACPDRTCTEIDTLKPGFYSVTVAVTYTTNIGAVRYDTLTESFVINAASEPCFVKVFTGVSANNDNVNDYFAIENIKEFPNNRVSIYNRWGNLLFDVKGYDQEVEGKRWPTDDHLSTLTSSTYFYIIELGNGSKPMKGWVELIKN